METRGLSRRRRLLAQRNALLIENEVLLERTQKRKLSRRFRSTRTLTGGVDRLRELTSLGRGGRQDTKNHQIAIA